MKKKNEKAFLINVMWVPLFVGIMTAALSKAPGVDSYIAGFFMGAVGVGMCYLDYRVFMKNYPRDENAA